MRCFRSVALFLFVAVAWTGARATGTIDSAGATIAAGASGGTTGTVLVDPCAEGGSPLALPAIDALGSIGSITLPAAASGGGTGADGAFHATTNQTLPGGDYNFTTYDVDYGVVVTYSGAVTIHATGVVNLQGSVVTTADGASITFLCGENLSLAGDQTKPAAIRTSGTAGYIVIDARTSISTYTLTEISTVRGDIFLTAHAGEGEGSGPVSFDHSRVRTTTAGNITIRGSDIGIANSTEIESAMGNVLLRAYSGGATFVSTSFARAVKGDVTAETATYLRFFYGSNLASDAGNVFATSFAERVELTGAAFFAAYAGSVTVRAGQYVTFTQTSYAKSGQGGDVTVTAFGGDVWIEPPQEEGCSYIESGRAIDVAASDNVFLSGDSYLSAAAGDIHVRAVAGDITLAKSPAVTATQGAIDLRAFRTLVATTTEPGPNPEKLAGGSTITLDAVSIALSSGEGGIDLPLDHATATGGTMRILSQGAVALGGTFTAEGDVTIASCDDAVDVVAATVQTEDTAGEGSASGDVLVASYAGTFGSVAAAGAVIRSGAGEASSGDVTVAVYDAAWGTVIVDSFFLPKKLAVKRNAAAPAKSTLKASGYFDTGSKVVDLTAAATLTVGTYPFAIPALTASPDGRTFTYDAGGLRFIVVKNPYGSSRAKFRLQYTGDLGAAVPTDGRVRLSFQNDAVDGVCDVLLANGGFRIGKKRGALAKPNLFVVRANAVIKGGTKDTLTVIVGIATGGVTPDAAREVRVTFGAYGGTIPADQFKRKGDVYEFKAAPGAIGFTSVRVDYLREIMTITARGFDLSDLPEGASPSTILVGIGSDDRGVAVRVARKGGVMKY